MPKRLVRKLDLELFLSQIESHPSPKPSLEQYTIPSDVAATILYIAAYTHNNIAHKTVIDLGCGTGKLALGAAFLGAKKVIGVDIDKTAIKTALKNTKRLDLTDRVQWIVADIDTLCGKFDVVLQNPPFGIQKRGVDRKFIGKALEIGKTIYSIHKHPHINNKLLKKIQARKNTLIPIFPSPFLEKFIEAHGGKVIAAYAMSIKIPHMFHFHRKKKHEFLVELLVIEKRKRK
jgi:putative methylase